MIRAPSKGDATDSPGVVWQRVQDIFSEFCDPAVNSFKAASAYWITESIDPGDIEPHEVIVYLIKDRNVSLIRTRFPADFQNNPPGPNTLGLTAVGKGKNLSEVYFDHSFHQGEPVLLANTIIHELMHNKLDAGNVMHSWASQFAGALGGFLQENLPNTTGIVDKMARRKLETTKADIDRMKPALSKVVGQNTGI